MYIVLKRNTIDNSKRWKVQEGINCNQCYNNVFYFNPWKVHRVKNIPDENYLNVNETRIVMERNVETSVR